MINILKAQSVGKIFLNYTVEATSLKKASQTAEVFLNPRVSHKVFHKRLKAMVKKWESN